MSIKIEESVTTVKSVTEAAGELSVTQLIMDASPLVQGVMLFLLLFLFFVIQMKHFNSKKEKKY